MASQPSIREFPHDSCVWRLDWLGDVEQTGYEPKVDVHVSLLPDFGAPGGELPSADRRVISVGVGQFPYLCTGSRWLNGKRKDFDSRDIGAQWLRGIRFDEGTIRRVPFLHVVGERFDRDGRPQNLWMVPPYSYAIPTRLGKTHCFAIEYGGDPYGIVVPAHEIVRFYYGKSSDLALAMFRGTLAVAPREVWDLDRCSIDEVNGRRLATIARAKRMDGNDCWVLARIFGDENARRGAYGIYEALLRASANRERAFIDTDIPFRGVANWKARAVKIAGVDGRQRWLVLEILSCSAAFPYDDLTVIADNDNSSGPEGASAEDKRVAFPGMHDMTQVDADDELRSDAPPTARVRQITLLNPGECFEALRGKNILPPPPKAECHYRSGEPSSPVVGLADMATGIGTYGESRIKPAEVVMDMGDATSAEVGGEDEAAAEIARREAMRATFENLSEVAAELAKVDGVVAQIRESKQVARVPLTAEPHKRQWSWLDSDARRPRAVMVVDVVCADRSASVIEFQQRARENFTLAVLVTHGLVPLDDAALARVLRDLAGKHGVWKNVPEPDGVRIVGLKHTRTSAGGFAEAIVGAIGAADL